MAMTLYHGEPNGPSFTVLAALFETGVEAELMSIDLARGERHILPEARETEVAMSIEGEGPVLVSDGDAMADSVFIACYLNEIGNGAIAPTAPYKRWEMMTWCRRVIERLAPAASFLGARAHLAALYGAMSDGEFDKLVSAIESVDLRDRWVAIRANDFPEEKLADSSAKVAQFADLIEDQLADREWLLGDFSIADLETYAWAAGMVEIEPAAYNNKPRLTAWRERVEARPAVKKALLLARTPAPEANWAPGPEINRWG